METDGLPTPRRYWAMLSIGLGVCMSVLDSTIANVALPTIARELGVTPAESVWVINAFQVAMVVCLLPFASLGEILGYKRVYRFGIALFTLSSLACALADSLPVLAVARAAQGMGAASILAVNAGLIRHIHPHTHLGRGIAINSAVVGASMAFGPSLGAAVLAACSWHWIFAINVPFGLFILFAVSRALPENEPSPRAFDLVGAGLNAVAFGLIILAVEGLVHGQPPSVAAVQIGIGLVAGAILVRWSLGRPAPLAPVDLLRIPILSLSLVTGMCAFAAHMAANLTLPFVMQYGYGLTPAMTGLLMTPWPLAQLAAAPLAGRLADRYPAGLLGGIGLGVMALGLLLLALLPPDPTAPDMIWRMVLCGLGFGFFQTPNNRALLGSAPRARTGAAGGLLAMGRVIGFTIGAIVAAVLFNLNPTAHDPTAAMLTCAAFAFAAALISLTRIGKEVQG